MNVPYHKNWKFKSFPELVWFWFSIIQILHVFASRSHWTEPHQVTAIPFHGHNYYSTITCYSSYPCKLLNGLDC